MANYTDKPKKKNTSASRDIAVDKLDFYSEPHPRRKQDKIKGRPKSGWQRFCIAAFPQTDDEPGEKVRKVVLIVAIFVFVVTLGFLGWQLWSMGSDKNTNSDIANIGGVGNDDLVNVDPNYDPFNTSTRATTEAESEEINVTPLENTPIYPNWTDLKSTNADTRAWIKITGTSVNNVVVQSSDNDYYLKHDFFKNDSISGTVFSSYKNRWDGTDDNIILYGHNMISGEFFAHVTHYVPNGSSREPFTRCTPP